MRARRSYWPSFSSSTSLASIVDSSLSLPISALAALAWANTAPASYERFSRALAFPVNEVAMAFFFGLAAKEVVEATAPGGALHTWRRAALPVIAAVGGMAAPALIYLAISRAVNQPALARGWAIPCATDVAFSYLAARIVFRRRHPAIPFLLLLAVADDAFGLVVLAVFYPSRELHLVAGGLLMVAALSAAVALRRLRIVAVWPYLTAAAPLSWAALFIGGLHPALALVPIVALMPHAARDSGLFVPARPDAVDTLSQFERRWKLPVAVTLCLFGLVNAGVPLGAAGRATWAVLAAVLIGKPVGIAAAVAVSLTVGFRLPARFGWRELVTVGFAAAIGFTVALFFATAAFPPGPLLDQAKLGALSSVAGLLLTVAAAASLRVGRFASVSEEAAGP